MLGPYLQLIVMGRDMVDVCLGTDSVMGQSSMDDM